MKRFGAIHLQRLAREGAEAEALVPVYPSKTVPNHYSIITGLYPEDHGIVANEFYDPDLKAMYRLFDRDAVENSVWYTGEPLWVTAEKQGVLTASFFWLGSEAPIGGTYPTYRIRPYDGKVASQARTAKVIEWLSLPADRRPHFITVYFPEVDSMSHSFGTFSDQSAIAAREIDRTIADLADWIRGQDLPVYLVIVSDHGMDDVEKTSFVALDDLADLSDFQVVGAGPQSYLYSKSGNRKTIAATYRKLASQARKNQFQVFLREDLPARYHLKKSKRAGDLMVLADHPNHVGIREVWERVPLLGHHGWDPEKTPTMNATFILWGPQVKPGFRLGKVSALDVRPWISQILGLTEIKGLPSKGGSIPTALQAP